MNHALQSLAEFALFGGGAFFAGFAMRSTLAPKLPHIISLFKDKLAHPAQAKGPVSTPAAGPIESETVA